MDHHVPIAIADGLRDRLVDVITAQEDGAAEIDDESLLARATELDRVLFSQDRDLLTIGNRWLRNGQDFTGLIYAHQLGITIGRAVRDLELMSAALDPEDMCNQIEFLPL